MIEYLLKSSAILILFYGVYKVLLERETFFQSIRAYLLLGWITAIALPLLEIKKYVTVTPIKMEAPATVAAGAKETLAAAQYSPEQVIAWIYLAGLLFFSGRLLFQLASLVVQLSRQAKQKEGRYRMLPQSKNIPPFSFFNYIVYPEGRFEPKELDQVLAHEKRHADQLHSLDVLLSRALCAFQWFNPFAWLYHAEIEKNLEYIADSAPELRGHEGPSYELLLLKTVQPEYQLALTSNFYQSLIKKRIKMLQKNRSNALMHLKFALIIPLLAAFVMNFNTRIVAQQATPAPEQVRIEEETEVITKDFSKSDLESLKANLLKQGVEMKYRKLKYNEANEILGIELTVSNAKGNKAQMSQSGDRPIAPISITFDKINGTLALGNTSLHHEAPHALHKKIQKEIHKEIIIDKDGDKEVIIIGGDRDHVRAYDMKDAKDVKVIKEVKVIELDEDAEGVSKVIIKKGGPVEDEFLFIGDGDEQPLIIIDGKEFPDMNMEDVDQKKIETIEILKGDKAVEEYGEKAKNGVVIIKTRK